MGAFSLIVVINLLNRLKMSSRLSNHSTESTSKYNDKELFKSIDLKFFEDEGQRQSPEAEPLNETFTKSSARLLETVPVRESAAYEDDFNSDEESEPSFDTSSDSAKFREGN